MSLVNKKSRACKLYFFQGSAENWMVFVIFVFYTTKAQTIILPCTKLISNLIIVFICNSIQNALIRYVIHISYAPHKYPIFLYLNILFSSRNKETSESVTDRCYEFCTLYNVIKFYAGRIQLGTTSCWLSISLLYVEGWWE